MQIENIISALPPPLLASALPREDWHEIEHRLGTGLPLDYKMFVERYGSGRIDGFIWVFNPFSENQNINLMNQLSVRVGGIKYLSERFPGRYRYPLFPEPGGLFPFAGTDNGDTVYWVTDGDPGRWWVAVNDARSPEFEEFRFGAVEFLHGILTRRIVCGVFPTGFPTEPHRFEPASSFPRP